MPPQDVWEFTPVSYRTSALWGRCPALTLLLQLITTSKASGSADHVRSLDDLFIFVVLLVIISIIPLLRNVQERPPVESRHSLGVSHPQSRRARRSRNQVLSRTKVNGQNANYLIFEIIQNICLLCLA